MPRTARKEEAIHAIEVALPREKPQLENSVTLCGLCKTAHFTISINQGLVQRVKLGRLQKIYIRGGCVVQLGGGLP